ncbi:MAG: tRNA dihydrouridine synthase DusB [Verrucomicrobiae bacterium]|nr:tRNA dihydrouridine synthase DusB [Verrucomicrobiae bacterium]
MNTPFSPPPPLRFGSLELSGNLVLAPMAGYTSLPFRMALHEIGGLSLGTSDLVNARSLIEKNPNAFKLIRSGPQDRPLAIQLFGAVPEEMRDAALVLESRGVDVVDVNMGCPVPKVCKVGGGAAMMAHPARAFAVVKAMADALRIPLTCKIRLGIDSLIAPDFARALADLGVKAIAVHGRTKQQGFDGEVDLDGIRKVVKAVPQIPVIGNGDITTPLEARKMLEETGCAGVMAGRGAFYNPWIFRDIRHYFATGEILPEASFDERFKFMARHLDLLIETFGEKHGCPMFRKMAPLYVKRLGPAAEFKRKIFHLQTRAQFDEITAHYRQWREEILGRKNSGLN